MTQHLRRFVLAYNIRMQACDSGEDTQTGEMADHIVSATWKQRVHGKQRKAVTSRPAPIDPFPLG